MITTAVFGGTFNPFHLGHFEILKALCEQDFIDEVFVMPDRIPPHKEFDVTISDCYRKEMCRIACEKLSKATLCLIEFEREGKSYTYDTVMELKKRYPDRCFYIVCGGDMIASLDSWYNFEELKKEVGFIAFNRNGDIKFDSYVSRLRLSGAEIKVIEEEITSVSSSELRKNLDKNLLPQNIYNFIKRNGIYDGKQNK